LAGDLATAGRRTEATQNEAKRPSSPASPLNNELILANSSFRTYEFESALADIAGDISDVWSQDDSNAGDLEDFFPFDDIARTGK
jgi:hypothetical protein